MKQNRIKIFGLLLLAGIAFSLPSCLKNNDYYTDFSKGAPAVELPLAASKANGPTAVSFDVSNTPVTYYAVVNVASPDKPTSVVTATLALDAAYLATYNAKQTADDPDNYIPFELMPDSTYSITRWDATIQPGHRQDSVPIKIFTNKIESGHNYLLPLTITKSSLPISNWNHLMVNIGAKNQYDGVYKSSGLFIHPAYGTLTWEYSDGITQQLITSGATSVSMYPTNTSIGGFGVQLDIKVNADNSISEVFNGVTTPTPNSDRYDPDTKTFYVSGSYVGGSGPRVYKATLQYVGPR
ncbi:MAG: DUF1735 domain-containing protein [Ginsengibacter sp.]